MNVPAKFEDRIALPVREIIGVIKNSGQSTCRGFGLDDPSSPDLEFGLASSLNPDDLSSLVSIASTTLL